MSSKSNFVVAFLVLFYFILFYFLHRRGLWLFEKSRARNKTKPIMTSMGDKISCTALKGLCDVLPTSKWENEAFPSPPPPGNVVSLYTIPVTDTPPLTGGKGRGADCFVIERMTCHCFLWPIRRDLTSSSHTTADCCCAPFLARWLNYRCDWFIWSLECVMIGRTYSFCCDWQLWTEIAAIFTTFVCSGKIRITSQWDFRFYFFSGNLNWRKVI